MAENKRKTKRGPLSAEEAAAIDVASLTKRIARAWAPMAISPAFWVLRANWRAFKSRLALKVPVDDLAADLGVHRNTLKSWANTIAEQLGEPKPFPGIRVMKNAPPLSAKPPPTPAPAPAPKARRALRKKKTTTEAQPLLPTPTPKTERKNS